jgi:hypothetical protein
MSKWFLSYLYPHHSFHPGLGSFLPGFLLLDIDLSYCCPGHLYPLSTFPCPHPPSSGRKISSWGFWFSSSFHQIQSRKPEPALVLHPRNAQTWPLLVSPSPACSGIRCPTPPGLVLPYPRALPLSSAAKQDTNHLPHSLIWASFQANGHHAEFESHSILPFPA